MLKAFFPFTDAWKFLKTGSEACSAAIRIARAATGRSWVASDGYHGFHDSFVSLTEPAIGVPRWPNVGYREESTNPMHKLHSIDQITSSYAAVIIEPVITDWSDDRRRYLQELRETCTKHGVMLIFDEVITGFRWPKLSVSNCWGITPDLIVLGKAIANGMPLAAVGGKYAVMNGAEYFVSSTYAGETLSLVAAKKTIELLHIKDMNWLWRKGQDFIDQFNSVCPEKVRLEGYPTRGILTGDPLCKALFMQEAVLAGMLWGPSYFYNFPLAEEAPHALGAIKAILGRIDRGEVKLKGEMPSSPFAQKVREKI